MRIVQVPENVLELPDLESVLQLANTDLSRVDRVRKLLYAPLKLEDVYVVKVKSTVNGLRLAI